MAEPCRPFQIRIHVVPCYTGGRLRAGLCDPLLQFGPVHGSSMFLELRGGSVGKKPLVENPSARSGASAGPKIQQTTYGLAVAVDDKRRHGLDSGLGGNVVAGVDVDLGWGQPCELSDTAPRQSGTLCLPCLSALLSWPLCQRSSSALFACAVFMASSPALAACPALSVCLAFMASLPVFAACPALSGLSSSFSWPLCQRSPSILFVCVAFMASSPIPRRLPHLSALLSLPLRQHSPPVLHPVCLHRFHGLFAPRRGLFASARRLFCTVCLSRSHGLFAPPRPAPHRTSPLTSRKWARPCWLSSLNSGLTALQGPHQVAVKSASTA